MAQAACIDVPTTDLLITAPCPTGDDWQTTQQVADTHGIHVALLKCKRGLPGEFFFLLAKDYTVPAAQVLPPQTLCEEVYRKDYEKLFAKVTYLRSAPLAHQGFPAHEITLELVHAARGVIHKRERVVTCGAHVIVLSAEGAPADVLRHEPATQRWFDGARFATLNAAR